MFKKARAFMSCLLSGALLLGTAVFEPSALVSAAGTPAAQFIAADKTTQGQWIGKYGADGYLMPYYKVLTSDGRDKDGSGATINYGMTADLSALPGYVGSYSQEFGGTSYWVQSSAATSAAILQSPDSSYPAKPVNVQRQQALGFQFNLNDTQQHRFTVYATDFGSEKAAGYQLTIELWSTDNTAKLASYTIDSLADLHNGVYVSFDVTGSFIVKTLQAVDGSSKAIGNYAYAEGFFFGGASAQTASPIKYLGEDTATSGNWTGRYGTDGYLLPYYKAQMLKSDENGSFGRDDGINGNTTVLDLPGLPGYATGYIQTSSAYWIRQNPTTDPVSLQTPDSTYARKKVSVYSGTTFSYTFTLSDAQPHLFTLYTADFKGESAQNFQETFEIRDAANNLAAAHTVSGLSKVRNGVYVSFLVQGTFTVTAKKAAGNTSAYMEGFFFDSVPANTLSGVTAAYAAPRTAVIGWQDSSTANAVSVQRKGPDEDTYSEIAVVPAGTHTYTDANLASGSSYSYRLGSVSDRKYSDVTDAYTVDVPAYTSTTLALTGQTTETVGDTLHLTATLQSAGGQPEEGKMISFRLAGSHVGDGTSLGQEIPADLGTAVTGADGAAVLDYPCGYTGSYTVTAAFADDDSAQLSGASSAPLSFTVNPVAWTAAPVIFKVSDAVAPGQSFSVNGYGIDQNTVDIAIERDTDGSSPAAPSGAAAHPAILQKDTGSNFVVAAMPDDAAPGVYNVWVKNAYGWSNPYKMNAARAQYQSEYQAFQGLDIAVVGRNFDQSEFGGAAATQVRLNDGDGHTYPVAIKSLSPYNVTFTVGGQPLGTYSVEVSNDNGVNWSRVSSGQTLEIVSTGADPLDLGVAWAKDFKWDNVIDVTAAPYDVDPNSAADDTAAVQAAVDAAEAAGGGVVYFPNGSYSISQINIGAGVVLEGQSEYGTKLSYSGMGQNFINSKDTSSLGGVAQLQGVTNLSLLLSDPQIRPDCFLWLGEQWGASKSDSTLRTANRIFVKSVNIATPTDDAGASGTGRGMGLVWIAKERALLLDNHFVGWQATDATTYVTNYCTQNGNYLEYANGRLHNTANYAFIENNYITVHYQTNQDSHGIFTRADAYVANNYVEGAGAIDNKHTDGEGICSEPPAGAFNAGLVLTATSTSVTVAPNLAFAQPVVNYGELSVTITAGRGLGQMRRVKSIDLSARTIVVDQPFDVTPDGTSRFTLTTPNESNTIYQNVIKNCLYGIMPYGNAYDDVIANNTTIDTKGITVHGVAGGSADAIDYFVRIQGNTVTGGSRIDNQGGIGFNTGRWNAGGALTAVQIYSNEVRDNTIVGSTGTRTTSSSFPYSGIPLISYGYSTQSNGQGTGDQTNTIVEGNDLSNFSTPVLITQCNDGQVIRSNRYDNAVTQLVTDQGDHTLSEYNQPTGLDTPAQPTVAVSVSTPGPVRKGDQVTLGAALTAGGAPLAGKTLTFLVDGKAVGTAITAEDGSASVSYTVPQLSGNHNVTVSFAGDEQNGLTSAVGGASLYALPYATQFKTSVTVTLDATSGVQAGDTATLTATVAADGGIPSGTVSFTVDGTALGSPVLLDDTGKAAFTWTNVPGGTHVLEAQYSGDPAYTPGTGTVASYEVSKLNQTTPLTLGGVPQSVTYGDAPFALSVSGGSGGGVLSYSVSGSAVTVDADGQVSVQGAGSAVVTVTKAGDDTYNPVSASVTVTVAKAQSRIVTLPTVSAVTAPAALSAAVLTGGAGSVPGTFAWSQPDAAVTEPGSYEVTFTPADAANYLSSTGMVSVSVTARRLADDTTGVQVLLPQGALPEGVVLQDVRLSVTPVTGGAAFAQAQAALASAGTKFSLFDIRLYAGAAPLEPTKPVQVSLPIPDGFDTAHLMLYTIKDDGTAEPVTGGSVQGGLYVFTASHFSSYALVDTSGADTSSAPSSAASSGSASSAESAGNPSTGVGTPAGAAVVVFGAAACAALLFGRRRRGRHNG